MSGEEKEYTKDYKCSVQQFN